MRVKKEGETYQKKMSEEGNEGNEMKKNEMNITVMQDEIDSLHWVDWTDVLITISVSTKPLTWQ